MDVIPGHENKMSITAEEPGIYYGECAEFCGAQHAWMRFKVIAMPEDDFYSWVNTMRTGNPGTANPDAELPEGVTRAPANFSVCLACHAVNGFDGGVNLTGMEAPKTFGPNLTNLACRETIAAGMLINNPENLKTWLHDPGAVKPENYMATQIRAGMYSDEELDELVDYLTTLQPANGCDGNGESTANSGTPQVVVASPEAAAGDD
jgi:cytochrome c oxidase subunit 2